MHKQRTQFSKRVNRVAKSLERRGIAGTYKLHERLLANRSARSQLAAQNPQLDDVQKGILADLERDGYALRQITDLIPEELWQQLAANGEAFAAETEKAIQDGGAALRQTTKDFMARRYAFGASVATDDPWLRLALEPRLLDLANAYVGLWTKLEYVDLWYTIPQGPEAERVSSQRWHRDFNDRRLVKVFVYLNDVDEEAGPFEYIAGSAPGRPLGDLWPWEPDGLAYPPQDELAKKVDSSAMKSFTGKRGTVIFCDTSGFHRGGFARTKPRVLGTLTFASPAALKALSERNFKLDGAVPDGLPEPATFALS